MTGLLLRLLGFISMAGALSVDMYLPSFGNIASDLSAHPSSVQLTLTAFMAGVGIGQLFHGVVSDRVGRRRVVVPALAVFFVSTLAIVFVPNIELFIGLRLVQGLSAAAAVVISRAIVVDISDPKTAVKSLSMLAMVSALGPLIAPLIGGPIAAVANWRAVLVALTVIAATMFVAVLLLLPESLLPENRQRGPILNAYKPLLQLLKQPRYTAFILVFALSFGGLMSYISASSFVAQSMLGANELQYAIGFAISAAAILIGNLINSRIAPRVGPFRMLMIGSAIALTAVALLVLQTALGVLSVVSFVANAFLLVFGNSFVGSNASALALAETKPYNRGSGAALMGSLQLLIGASITPLVGLGGEHTAVPMLVCLAACALASFGCALYGSRQPRG